MTPQDAPFQPRSSVEITRNTKSVQANVKVYNGDTDLTEAMTAAKAAFLDLDGFCQRVTDAELADKLARSMEAVKGNGA